MQQFPYDDYMVLYTASGCPPCNSWATCLYVWSKKVLTSVSEHLLSCVLKCFMPHYKRWSCVFIGVGTFKSVVFSHSYPADGTRTPWLAAVSMVGDTAGQSDPRQWSAKCETMLNQGWSSDDPRWVRGLPKPDYLDLSHLKWTNSSWTGSCHLEVASFPTQIPALTTKARPFLLCFHTWPFEVNYLE